jgi:hypothetical protein
VPPFIALDFDQHVIAKKRTVVNLQVGDFETIEHLAQYGRPLYALAVSIYTFAHCPPRWHASLSVQRGDEMVRLASAKLTNGTPFDAKDRNHVFAVLSQRLCLEPVLAGAEAIKLADRSVAHHMRLLTGFSANHAIFYTQSPSEPVLVLGAINILYNHNDPKRLGNVLDTFSNDLCRSGLVDKGNLGELAARILLLLARDYAAPAEGSGRNFLKPVPLLEVIHKLFGKDMWGGVNQGRFEDAFRNAHVNFTHWIVTKDPLPEVPDQ